jgi:hypothetical protein
VPDPTTIPKNATRQLAPLREELTECRVYSLENGFTGQSCDPSCAWGKLPLRNARLFRAEDGSYTIHVHSNLWYELRRPDPARVGDNGPLARARTRAGDERSQQAALLAGQAGSALGGDAALRLYQQQTGFRAPEDARIQGTPTAMDLLAKAIAWAVQADLVTHGCVLQGGIELDQEPGHITCQAVDDTTTEVRVVFPVSVPQRMARVFHVRVAEVTMRGGEYREVERYRPGP